MKRLQKILLVPFLIVSSNMSGMIAHYPKAKLNKMHKAVDSKIKREFFDSAQVLTDQYGKLVNALRPADRKRCRKIALQAVKAKNVLVEGVICPTQPIENNIQLTKKQSLFSEAVKTSNTIKDLFQSEKAMEKKRGPRSRVMLNRKQRRNNRKKLIAKPCETDQAKKAKVLAKLKIIQANAQAKADMFKKQLEIETAAQEQEQNQGWLSWGWGKVKQTSSTFVSRLQYNVTHPFSFAKNVATAPVRIWKNASFKKKAAIVAGATLVAGLTAYYITTLTSGVEPTAEAPELAEQLRCFTSYGENVLTKIVTNANLGAPTEIITRICQIGDKVVGRHQLARFVNMSNGAETIQGFVDTNFGDLG